MLTSDMEDEIERALETFNEYNIDSHMEEFAPGATFSDPVLDEPVSGETHREYLLDVFDAFPDIHQEPKRVFQADEATTVESTFHGTHEGPLEGVPPTGKPVSVPFASIIAVSDDGITFWRDYWDQQTFREQLGLTFPAIVGHIPRFVSWGFQKRL